MKRKAKSKQARALNISNIEKQRQEILRRRFLQQLLDNKICP